MKATVEKCPLSFSSLFFSGTERVDADIVKDIVTYDGKSEPSNASLIQYV